MGNTWGIPGGKLDAGDTAISAVIRELIEETALTLTSEEIEELKPSTFAIQWQFYLYNVSQSFS